MARNDVPDPRVVGTTWSHSPASGVTQGYFGANGTNSSRTYGLTTGATAVAVSIFAATAAYATDIGGQPVSAYIEGVCNRTGHSTGARLHFYDVNGTPIGTTVTGTAASTTAGAAHVRRVVTTAAPAWTRFVRVALVTSTLPANTVILASSARIDLVNDTALPFRDGSSTGWRWIGAANASASTDVPLVEVIDETSVGTTTWVADYAGATAVAAGYSNYDYNRQTALGNGAASGLAWPPPTEPAPFGLPGRALMLRLPDGGRRHEVVPTAQDYIDGNVVWVGFSCAFDADTPWQDATGYQAIWQIRPDDSTGSPPVALELDDGQLVLTGGYGRPGANPAGQYSYRQDLGAVTPRRWFRVVLRLAVSSAPNSGRLDLWFDDVRVLTNFVPPPGTNYSAGPMSLKNGAYHDPANRGMTVWFADHKHGTGYQAVAPPVAPAWQPGVLV